MRTDPGRRERFENVAADVFEPVQHYLLRRAPAADAADAFGETLLVIWRRLDDVPADDPLPWCYGVARRCLANLRRSDARRLRLVDRVASASALLHTEGWGDPQDAVERHDPELAAALNSLTDAEAEVVRLWAWERLEPREIATALDTTPNAVSVALSRARRKLAAELDRQDRRPAGHSRSSGTAESGRSER